MFLLLVALVLVCGCLSNFVDNPSNSTALTNQPFTISCRIHNDPPLPPVVVWLKNQNPIDPDFPGPGIQIAYNTTTGLSTYKINNVQYSDAGTYQCVAQDNNENPFFISTVGTLTVVGLPVFTTLLQPISVAIGGTAVFTCSVQGNPSFTISWSYNGQTLSTGGQYVIGTNTLTISNAQTTNNGFYKCTATNIYGKNSTIAKLTVLAVSNPVVTITEGSTYQVGLGSNFILHCTVQGKSITYIRWVKFGNPAELTQGVSKSSDGATLSFTSVTQSDESTYTCTANSTGGGFGQDFIFVDVISPPVVSVFPTFGIKLAGSQLTFTESPLCSIIAGDTGDIIWRGPDGAEVNSNGNRLNLVGNLQTSDAGIYQCVAVNLGGTGTANYQLTVNAIPKFTIKPSNVLVSYGQDVLLQCMAEGVPTPTITWSKNDGSAIQSQAVFTSQGLHLYSVSSSDDGTYICSASNFLDTNTTTATVTVTIPPHVNSISPHDDYYLPLGSTISISCNISTLPGTTVSWYHNNTKLTASGRIQLTQPSSSIWSMTVFNAVFSDNGLYWCNVTNNYVFDFVSLQVIIGVKASIVSAPIDLNITQNREIIIPCVVNGIPQPDVSWYKTEETGGPETQLQPIGAFYRIENNGLRLLNTQRNDSGYYRCLADNRVSSENQTARIRVEGAPLAVNITPLIITAGMTYRLQCHIFYNLPAPSFEWFGANFQTLDPSRFSVDSNGELVISPVQGDDQMDFICRPSNAYGASTVAQFITVYVSPVVTLSRTEVIAILDSNLTVTCAATGRPSPQIEMFFPNGEPANSFFDPVTGLLHIASIQATQAGTFLCRGTNIVGTNNATVQVDIRGAAPQNPIANPIGATQMQLRWNPPNQLLSGKLLSYNVNYGVKDLSERLVRNLIGLSTFLEDLEEYTEYEFEIKGLYADNVDGLGAIIYEFTNEAAPSGAPQNITLTPFIETLEVFWLPLERFDQNGIIVNYTIFYRETPNNSTNTTSNYTVIGYIPNNNTADSFRFNITNLKGGASYDIQMQAYTIVGGGPRSRIVRATTKRAFPLVLVLGITIPIGVIILVVLLVLLGLFCYVCISRIKKAQLYSPRKGEEGFERKTRKKQRKNKPDVSDPMPEVSPNIDSSSKGKFILHRSDGTTIPSHPKIIQPGDVAKKRKSGAKVISVKTRESTTSSEFNPYDDPDEFLVDNDKAPQRRAKKNMSQKDSRRDGFVPRDSKSSSGGIYEDPTDAKTQKTRSALPTSKKKESVSSIYDDMDDDLPVEMPVVIKPRHNVGGENQSEDEDEELPIEMPVVIKPRHTKGGQQQQQQQQQQEEDDDDLPIEMPVVIKPRHTKGGQQRQQQQEEENEDSDEDEPPVKRHRRPSLEIVEEEEEEEDEEEETDDESNLYARVSQAHIQKKRSKILREKQKEQERKRKEKEKIDAKKKKEQQQQQKKLEKAKKKEMKDKLKRQSLGLDNIISLQDLDLSSRAGRQLRLSMDSSNAEIF